MKTENCWLPAKKQWGVLAGKSPDRMLEGFVTLTNRVFREAMYTKTTAPGICHP